MSNLNSFIIIFAVLLANLGSAQEIKSKADYNSNKVESFDLDFKSSLRNTSNALKLPINGPSGTSLDVELQIFKDFFINNDNILSVFAAGTISEYTESDIKEIANQNQVQIGANYMYFLNDHLSFSIEGGISSFDGRQIDFSNIESTQGIDSRYRQSLIGFNANWDIDDKNTIEAGVKQLDRDDTTITFDEIGTQFKDSRSGLEYYSKYTREIGFDQKLEIKVSESNKNYDERPAKFSQGTPGATNPMLKMSTTAADIKYKFLFFGTELTIGSQLGLVKDEVFAAEDALTSGINITSKINISSNLKVESKYSRSVQDFDTFIATPILNPNNSELRSDILTHYSVKLEYSFTPLTVFTRYFDDQQISNYSIVSFRDQGFAMGLEYEL